MHGRCFPCDILLWRRPESMGWLVQHSGQVAPYQKRPGGGRRMLLAWWRSSCCCSTSDMHRRCFPCDILAWRRPESMGVLMQHSGQDAPYRKRPFSVEVPEKVGRALDQRRCTGWALARARRGVDAGGAWLHSLVGRSSSRIMINTDQIMKLTDGVHVCFGFGVWFGFSMVSVGIKSWSFVDGRLASSFWMSLTCGREGK